LEQKRRVFGEEKGSGRGLGSSKNDRSKNSRGGLRMVETSLLRRKNPQRGGILSGGLWHYKESIGKFFLDLRCENQDGYSCKFTWDGVGCVHTDNTEFNLLSFPSHFGGGKSTVLLSPPKEGKEEREIVWSNRQQSNRRYREAWSPGTTKVTKKNPQTRISKKGKGDTQNQSKGKSIIPRA